MLKKILMAMSVLTLASALGWVGYNSLAQASGNSLPEEQPISITTKTTKTIQGTPLRGGGCEVPGGHYRVSGSDPNKGFHGMITPIDPAKCTYVETLEPGAGDMPVKPTIENPIQWQGPNGSAMTSKTATLDSSCILRQGQYGRWTLNPYTGEMDDALVTYLQWLYDGIGAYYNNAGPWPWWNTSYGWVKNWGVNFTVVGSDVSVGARSSVGYFNTYVSWYDTYPLIAFYGYSNGDWDCIYSPIQQTFPSPIGEQCQIDW